MTERCKPDLNDPAQLPKQHLNPKHLLKHIGNANKSIKSMRAFIDENDHLRAE
jgi:hypothetical protein